MKSTTTPLKFLRLPQVEALIGCKKSSIYGMMNKGEFPKCIHVGHRMVAWDAGEVQAWMHAKLKARRA